MRPVFIIINLFCCQLAFGQLRTDCVYGTSGCGYAGSIPHCRTSMLKMVADRDTSQLSLWLYADSKEQNAYAIEGLYMVKDAGIAIAPKLIHRIKEIQADGKSEITTCGGCIYDKTKLWKIVNEYRFD